MSPDDGARDRPNSAALPVEARRANCLRWAEALNVDERLWAEIELIDALRTAGPTAARETARVYVRLDAAVSAAMAAIGSRHPVGDQRPPLPLLADLRSYALAVLQELGPAAADALAEEFMSTGPEDWARVPLLGAIAAVGSPDSAALIASLRPADIVEAVRAGYEAYDRILDPALGPFRRSAGLRRSRTLLRELRASYVQRLRRARGADGRGGTSTHMAPRGPAHKGADRPHDEL